MNQNRKTDIVWKIVLRCIGFILIMFLLSIVVFYFARLAPGDPLESFYGDRVETMTPVELEAARARLGLDGPIWMQYIHWLSGVFQGDFGISLKYKMPAMQVIAPLIGNTLILGLTGWIKSSVKWVLSVIIFLRFGLELY